MKTDRSFAGMLMLVTGVAVVAALCQEHVASHPAAVDDPYAAFCTPVMAEAIVTPGTPARHVISVGVPQDTPIDPVLASATSGPMQVQRGDVIEFRVVSRREGAIAVHGFTDVVRMSQGTGEVRFRATFTGRFPLHFHGRDQSHFEIAAIEVHEPIKTASTSTSPSAAQ